MPILDVVLGAILKQGSDIISSTFKSKFSDRRRLIIKFMDLYHELDICQKSYLLAIDSKDEDACYFYDVHLHTVIRIVKDISFILEIKDENTYSKLQTYAEMGWSPDPADAI